MTALPTSVVAGESLPDLEVRIMTSAWEFNESDGSPKKFPLTAGPDIEVDIQLTVGWENKLFALDPLPLSQQEGVDLDPLLYSSMLMDGVGIQTTYLGDLAIRKRATLLPGGYYGAIFSGIKFLNVSAHGVRLNFTMSYPGGQTYREQLLSYSMSPPQPFSRVGLGYTDYTPLWENHSRFDFLESGIDNEFLVPSGDSRSGTAYTIWEAGLYASNGSITALPNVTTRVYRGLGDVVSKANASDCAVVLGTERRAWCTSSGYKTSMSGDPGPGLLLTAPVIVQSANATSLSLTWDRNGTFDEVLNFESEYPIVLEVLDASGNRVLAGPDSELMPSVVAYLANGTEVQLCDIFRPSCAGTYQTNHVSGCNSSEGLRLQAGTTSYTPAVCEIASSVYLVFSLNTTAGLTLNATTQLFSVSNTAQIGVLLPKLAHGSQVDLPVRALKQMVEMITKGHTGPYDGNTISFWIHRFGVRFNVHYIHVANSVSETIHALRTARHEHGLRLIVGPYDDQHAEAIGDWIAAEMPMSYAFSPNAQSSVLEDVSRFRNLYRLRTTATTQVSVLIQALAARQWTKIAIIQDKSAYALPEIFYQEARLQGITILSDIDVGTIATENASMTTLLNSTRNSGARIIFTALTGRLTTEVYNNATAIGLSAAEGFQWFGNEVAHKSFPVDEIPDVLVDFAGIVFLTSAYGYRKSSSDWFNYHFVSESRELYTSQGGMDPFFVSQRGFDFTDLSPWAQQQVMLMGDAIMLTGWMWFWGIQGGMGANAHQALWEAEFDSATWSSWSGQCNMGVSTHGRESYTGMFVQLHSNLSTIRATHTASVPYNPWQITTGVYKGLGTDLVEGTILDLVTALPFPNPVWGTNVSVTQRTYSAVANINELGAATSLTDYVPVTHTCTGGCGGGLLNASASVYEFAQGTCVGPDNCDCVLRNSTRTPAFSGSSCETTVCDPRCVNGNCTFDNTTRETSCQCSYGWAGPTCAMAQCTLYGCAASSGSCVLPDTCQCQAGYYSADCGSQCKCVHGSCNDGAAGTGECTCDAGYFGPTCATKCTCVNGECNDGAQGNGQCTSCDSGYMGDDCSLPLAAVAVPATAGGLTSIWFVYLLVLLFMRRAKRAALLSNMDWKVDWSEVTMQTAELMGQSMAMQSMKFQSTTSMKGATSMASNIAKWKNGLACVEKVSRSSDVELSATLRQEIRDVREARHSNVLAFVGACVECPNVSILSTYCAKGSLDNILANTNIKLDNTFKESILKDIAKGLAYLHGTNIGAHGRLSSDHCLIDSRWTVQVGGFGLPSIRHNQEIDEELLVDKDAMACSLFWTAPEILRITQQTRSIQDITERSIKADVFAYGVIVSEVLTRTEPYFDADVGPCEVIQMIKKGVLASQQIVPPAKAKEAWSASNTDKFQGESARATRPTLPPDSESTDFNSLARSCWSEDPNARPTMSEVSKTLNTISPNKGEMIDNLIKMLEKYATNLEGIVAERTAELEVEKNKVEDLVCRMLPKSIVEDLKAGKDIKAESFDNVTIFFSDIVGFTSICSKSTPMQVVALLNALYTTFDNIIDEYDVYKVETIGDAYMVVSGLPNRNGDRHAGEIASMSLHLLSAMIDFKIPHLPDETLQLRVGMHSGPVVAGVVGVKMPRYCLFGDTVNIASRMESGGFALKIHMSESTQKFLEKLGGYHLKFRGEREVKGRGVMKTYWLTGKDGFNMPLPSQEMAVSESQVRFSLVPVVYFDLCVVIWCDIDYSSLFYSTNSSKLDGSPRCHNMYQASQCFFPGAKRSLYNFCRPNP